MAGRVAAFLEQIREIQLLEPSQLEEAGKSTFARGDDPTPLAKELVQRHWLTAFQTGFLVRGRGKDLAIGPYRVLDRLGEGGMGQVYKAYHSTMKRVVALKVIRKDKLGKPEAVKRFFQEVQAAAKLTHPNIVLAFDAGQAGDIHYFAMEFVEGADLSRRVKENGPLGIAEACEFVRQAALGLQHAHESGLVHRDIKPHNLLVARTPSGPSVKILDMGLARLTSGDTGDALTRDGIVLGTPSYLAPEQARNSHAVDSRADIYGLGCTFYYLLTGKPPFQGELTEVLLKHQTDDPEPIEKLRPEVPPAVLAIVRKMMAKKPGDRYQTGAEVAQSLGMMLKKKGAAGTLVPRPPKTMAPLPTTRSEETAVANQTLIGAWPAERRRRWLKLALIGLLPVFGLCAGAVLFSGKETAQSTESTQLAGKGSPAANPRKVTPTPKEPAAVDLLPLINIDSHHIGGGTWEKDNDGGLRSRQFFLPGWLLIPYAPPDEYAFSALIERETGEDAFFFGLVVSGAHCLAAIDAQPQKGSRTGLLIDGKLELPEDAHTGRLLSPRKASEIVCTVRKREIAFAADGKTVYRFDGERNRLSLPFGVRLPDSRCLFIGNVLSTCRITQLKLRPLSGEGRVLNDLRTRGGG